MSEKRKYPRIRKKVKSEVHSDEGMTFSNTVDMSHGGIFISTPEPLSIGSSINLTLQLPGGKSIELKGEVRWVRQDEEEGERAGMGIEFSEATEEELKKIGEIVE